MQSEVKHTPNRSADFDIKKKRERERGADNEDRGPEIVKTKKRWDSRAGNNMKKKVREKHMVSGVKAGRVAGSGSGSRLWEDRGL